MSWVGRIGSNSANGKGDGRPRLLSERWRRSWLIWWFDNRLDRTASPKLEFLSPVHISLLLSSSLQLAFAGKEHMIHDHRGKLYALAARTEPIMRAVAPGQALAVFCPTLGKYMYYWAKDGRVGTNDISLVLLLGHEADVPNEYVDSERSNIWHTYIIVSDSYHPSSIESRSSEQRSTLVR